MERESGGRMEMRWLVNGRWSGWVGARVMVITSEV
jgi:hypothetical protein